LTRAGIEGGDACQMHGRFATFESTKEAPGRRIGDDNAGQRRAMHDERGIVTLLVIDEADQLRGRQCQFTPADNRWAIRLNASAADCSPARSSASSVAT